MLELHLRDACKYTDSDGDNGPQSDSEDTQVTDAGTVRKCGLLCNHVTNQDRTKRHRPLNQAQSAARSVKRKSYALIATHLVKNLLSPVYTLRTVAHGQALVPNSKNLIYLPVRMKQSRDSSRFTNRQSGNSEKRMTS